MTPLVSLLLSVLTCFIFISYAEATTSLSYSFNAQSPPVARYGTDYSYQLASDTFVTDQSSLTYNASSLPSWLSFDSSTRTLYGTPPSDSKADQAFTFLITATDSSASTASDNCTLVLIDAKAPTESEDVLEVLQEVGTISSNTSVVIKPDTEFNITFPSDFFTPGDRDIVGYMGLSQAHTPLPIWLNFDSSSHTFYGTAPSVNSEIAPAQTYSVAYMASDVKGFSAAQVNFNILVGAHQFYTNITNDTVKVNYDTEFQYSIPLQDIFLDGKALQIPNISSVTINNTLGWLSVSESNATIVGDPTADVNNQTEYVLITIEDAYGDVVEYPLGLVVADKDDVSIFTSSSLNAVNATIGKFFQYSIEKYVLNKNATINVEYDPTVDWLKYHSDNFTFTGTPSSSFSGTTVELNATDSSGNSEQAVFQIESYKGKLSPTSSASASSSATASASSTASSTATAAATNSKNSSSNGGLSNKQIAILCGVLIPCLVILAAVLLWCCCCGPMKRRRNADQSDASRPNISHPILPHDPHDPEKNIGASAVPIGKSTSNNNGDTSGSGSTDTYGGLSPGGSSTTDAGLDHSGKDKDMTGPEWDSPKRVSHYNYMKMDEEGNESISSDQTHAEAEESFGSVHTALENASLKQTDRATEPKVSNTREEVAAAAMAAKIDHHQDEPLEPRAVYNNDAQVVGSRSTNRPAYFNPRVTSAASNGSSKKVRPRNSWRQTDGSDKRWQEHQSLDSTGTISTDELLTLRLVDRDSIGETPQHFYRGRSTFMEPTHSTILTPRHSVNPSDASSGIIKHLGGDDEISRQSSLAEHSHSSSMDSYNSNTSSGGRARGDGANELPTVAEESQGHGGNTATIPSDDSFQNASFHNVLNHPGTLAGTSDDDATSQYRTAESGEDSDGSGGGMSDDDDHIRAYRDSQGRLTWNQVRGPHEDTSFEDSDQTDTEAEQRATRSRYDPDTTLSGNNQFGDNRRDTVRLVDFTKARRGSTPAVQPGSGPGSGPANQANPEVREEINRIPTEQSVSAELAFI